MSDLAHFVLAYCRASGGIVEPPAHGVHDVLLPEAVAEQLGVSSYQRLAFDDAAPETATQLGYGHPLVERMVESARATTACARFFINAVRLDKRGLFDLATKALAFPNARLQPAPDATETKALHHLLQVNFKAALMTDEKHEQLISVWMDAQSGVAIPGPAEGVHLPLEEERRLPGLPIAPLAWLPGHDPTSREAMAGLLDRAAQAAVLPLADAIARLQVRSARYLELDRVRLEQYFDEIEADLHRRLQRASDEARRAALTGKIEAVRVDRAAKLADVTAKYRLRLELDPINAALITLPKVQLAVLIKNRHASAERSVVWDPLRHTLQQLLCDVCLRPNTALMLCAGGHLVCSDPACRAPQCVDCTRFYCRHCAAELVACVVCDRPICQHSRIRCPDCGRGTCREHARLCHAAAGEPQRIAAAAPTAPPKTASPAPAPVEAASGTADRPDRARTRGKAGETSLLGKKGKAAEKGKLSQTTKSARKPVPQAAPTYSSLRIEVIIEPHEPVVLGIVFNPRSRAQIARRVWELGPDGIIVFCECEKGPQCPVNRTVLMPASVEHIEMQLADEILQLRQEYAVSPRHVDYMLSLGHEKVRRLPAPKLGGLWKDAAAIKAAQATFAARYRRRR